MYSDYFSAQNKFCFKRVSDTRTRLLITSQLKYVKRPNFLAKGIIDRNAMGALRDSYNYLADQIPKLSQPEDHDFSGDISPINSSNVNDQLDETMSSLLGIDGQSEKDSAGSESETVAEMDQSIKDTFKRKTRARLNSSRQSISSSYSEYLGTLQEIGRPRLKTQVSYPSLHSSQLLVDRSKMDVDVSVSESNRLEEVSHGERKVSQIQTFKFLSYDINVDSLVRVFIIA